MDKINEHTIHKPGELYVEKSIRGTFGEETYAVYLEGDDTLSGNTLTLGLFPSEELAVAYFDLIRDTELIEKLREQMFRHAEDEIFLEPGIAISPREWEEMHPELVKYHVSNK